MKNMVQVESINLQATFDGIAEFWSPKVLACVNDQYVKAAKLKGQLVWHKHDLEDELFQVIKGRLLIQFTGYEVVLNAGDFCVVPRGVMHNPIAEEECWIILVETVTTKHTGDAQTALTKTIEQQLS